MDTFGFLCLLAVYIQNISAQCIRNLEDPCELRPVSLISPIPYGATIAAPEYLAVQPALATIQSSSALSQWALSMISPISPLTMPCLNGFGPSSLAASSGGGLFTSSFSPFAPTGIFINSQNYFDGTVSVAGQVPFLGSIALEGALPSAGTGAIVYGCGNGDIYILSEDVADSYDYGYDICDFGPYGYDRNPFGYGYGSRYY